VLSSALHYPPRMRAIALPRGRTGLHAVPTSVGVEVRSRPGYSWDGTKRGDTPFAVIQHTLAGAGALEHEGRRFALGPGTTMLVTVPHRHRYFLPAGGHWHFFFLVLTGREVLRLATDMLGAAGPVLTPGRAAADRLAAICLSLLDAETPRPGAASAQAYEAMALLYDETAAQPGDGPDWITPVTAHIARRLSGPLPVQDLADIAGMSRAHFVRQFTRAVGLSPSEHVFRLRMERAAHLLETSDLPVLEIARQCGFDNSNYFAKAFRRAFEVSPTAFRASGMYTMPVRRGHGPAPR